MAHYLVDPAWCECRNWLDGSFTNLGETLDYEGQPVSVRSQCAKSTYWTWLGYQRMCDDCGGDFSSPVEEFCERCIRAEPHCFDRPSTDPWRSWHVLWSVDRVKYRAEMLGIPLDGSTVSVV